MKTGKTSLALILLVSALSAAFAGQKIRTFRDIPSVAVEKGNGGWQELKLPKGPLGDLWTVRDGIANRYGLAMKLNQINGR